MNFVSWAFVGLLMLVMAARLTIGRRKIEPAFVWVLIASSVIFYSWHVPIYIGILLTSAGIDYWAALELARTPSDQVRRRRLILSVSLAANLGILGFFKYTNLLLDAAVRAAAASGFRLSAPEATFILPMGISFYTFQSMSYTIDVYRGILRPLDSFKQFFLYIIFFPQLVAGPIVRALEFLPQMPRPRRLRLRVFYEGAWLILLGFFFKMVCADNLAVYVDAHWDAGSREDADSGFALWLAVMFSGQIFADFAGYSSIARGLAYWLGYRLPINFNAPYIAASLKNFWERWHITLSSWLRDYLYVPLGGNRRGRLRTYVNLLVVMVLGGLWHGAAYTYIVWGAIHGGALAVERMLGLQNDRGVGRLIAVRAAWFVVVQAVVLVAWVFFRSASIGEASAFVANMAALDFRPWADWMLIGALFLAPLAIHHLWTFIVEQRYLPDLSPGARSVIAAVMAYCIVTLYAGTSDFIYFQF
ncbi:MAG TPA: MBOAT family O-acyltransferase [Vicinamibacterales bacterium]|nr:MBOAT family O-acyltransferase [Vicinamibacterales bacterium]